jgi:hypothetical protein
MGVRRNLNLLVAALAAAPAAALAQPLSHATLRPHDGLPAPKQAFEIDDFSFDIEPVLNLGSRGGAGAGKVTFNPIKVTRKADQASPRLFRMAATGEQFQTIVLNTLRHGRRVKVELHDVGITGYQRDGQTERFTLHPAYGRIAG